ncbi:DUF1269 domain-containing protein [Candidatus Daviesbacteria bacterium]|nr:DUF1269 domain-containing protein [Candidatus Daviesbacteria bacterium]
MDQIVIGIFGSRGMAEDAINELSASNFNPKDISIVMRNGQEAVVMRESTGANLAGGAVSGATAGGLLGGLAGLLVGVGAITIPSIGAILIGGPLAAALGLGGAAATTISGAVTGAVAGGLIGALTGLGIPDEDARIYEDRIKAGGVLIAVPTTLADTIDAEDILERNGAEQIRTLNSPATQSREERLADEYPAAYFSEIYSKRSRRLRRRG